jgi:hypothetical protein
MKKENRRYNRLNTSFQIIVAIIDKKNTNDHVIKIKADSVNISASGILFDFSESLKIGTNLLLSFFPLNAADEIIVEGTVVRSKKKKDDLHATAVHFTVFQKGDQSTLDDLLNRSWV